MSATLKRADALNGLALLLIEIPAVFLSRNSPPDRTLEITKSCLWSAKPAIRVMLWNNLGTLLMCLQKRYGPAESVFEQALESVRTGANTGAEYGERVMNNWQTSSKILNSMTQT